MSEPIKRCAACGGEGIKPGPRVCRACHGAGLRPLADARRDEEQRYANEFVEEVEAFGLVIPEGA